VPGVEALKKLLPGEPEVRKSALAQATSEPTQKLIEKTLLRDDVKAKAATIVDRTPASDPDLGGVR